jgi:hypothetical protein
MTYAVRWTAEFVHDFGSQSFPTQIRGQGATPQEAIEQLRARVRGDLDDAAAQLDVIAEAKP